MPGRKRRVLDISGPVALGTLCIGLLLLLISLATKTSYDRLIRQCPLHARAFRVMDVIDGVILKLRAAEKALTDYSYFYLTGWLRGRWILHAADPRESARYAEGARKKLENALRRDRELKRAHGELNVLIEKLREVEKLRGEKHYVPLGRAIGKVRSICESKLSSLSNGIPRAVVSRRKKLRKELKITLTAGAIVSAFGVLFCWSWYSGVRVRRRV